MESRIDERTNPLSRVPLLVETVRVRKREPFAYNPKTFSVLEFNPAGMAVLRLVDGQRSVLDIARTLFADADAEAVELIAGKCLALLEQCEAHGAIRWS